MDKLTELFNHALPIIVQAVFTAVGLWCGMKITKNKMDFVGVLIVAFACSLIGMRPEPWGLVFSLLFMFLLLWKFTGAKFFPDGVFLVLVSWGIGFSGKHLILYLAKHIK